MIRLISIIGAFEDITLSHGIIAVLTVVVMMIIVLNMRRRRPYDGSPRDYRREIDAAAASGANVQRSMEDLLVELEELSRKINSQVETQFAHLEQAIAEADNRISALRILIDASRKSEDSGRGRTACDDAAFRPADERMETGVDDRYRAVYELADQGLPLLEIARRLDQRIGEIELILNLRPK